MRADKYFSEKFGSRNKAKEKLVRKLIYANGVCLSPDSEVTGGETFAFLEENDFVSRGGDKLERGFGVFTFDVKGKIFADLGASTGGFTDCLLRRGAKRVYCVDVGDNQLAPALRSDPRVVVMENTNARYLTKASFPEQLDGIVSDLSFISLKLILPVIKDLLPEHKQAVLLFKPQFECGGKGLGKSGILPTRYHNALLTDFYAFCLSLSFYPQSVVNAPIRPKKNVEYIVLLSTDGPPLPLHEFIRQAEDFFENRK